MLFYKSQDSTSSLMVYKGSPDGRRQPQAIDTKLVNSALLSMYDRKVTSTDTIATSVGKAAVVTHRRDAGEPDQLAVTSVV